MKKNLKSKAPKIDPYLEGFMGKLLERFALLEKKMDLVLARSAAKSGNAEPAPAPRNDRTLYEAICADCHKICEVPFRPSEARPVYCKECFAKRKAGSSGKPSVPGMPVLTPVALAPKPVSKLGAPPAPVPSAAKISKKAGKTKLSKKTKKSK